MISGRVWKFGDNINTDLMLPGHAALMTPQEQSRLVFQANRPGWVDQIRRGDIVLGGRSFGLGSSRPAARSLRLLGIGCVVVDSLSRLFFRNCVNWGMLALECPGIHAGFEEGQTAEIALETWTVRNAETGRAFQAKPIPEMLLTLMTGGGIYPVLESRGLIARPKANAA